MVFHLRVLQFFRKQVAQQRFLAGLPIAQQPFGIGGPLQAAPQVIRIATGAPRSGFLAGLGKGLGKFFFGGPKRTAFTILAGPPVAGVIAQQALSGRFSPIERFKSGFGFAADPLGQIGEFFKGLFPAGLGETVKDITTKITTRTSPTFLSFAAPLLAGLGLGAGVSRLISQQVPPIGLSEEEKPQPAPIIAQQPTGLIPDIKITVKPQINVKAISRPKIINILQSSSFE